MQHGTRGCYQQGCRCLPCRAANAAYVAAVRDRHRKGSPLLGAKVPAGPTWRRIQSLLIEGFRKGELARRLGLRSARLQFDHERVTVKTAIRVQKLHRFYMSEGSGGD